MSSDGIDIVKTRIDSLEKLRDRIQLMRSELKDERMYI